MKNKYYKFTLNQNYFMCPKCKEAMRVSNNTISCKNNHCFDIAKKGYINFLSNIKPQKGYNKDFFECRRNILADGFYNHISDHIINLTKHYGFKNIIDIGCGEGFYSHNIKSEDNNIFALDFSKDAINVASRGINDICFMVADIQNIPIKADSMDCILNIYTPANYPEFKRILSAEGIIIKVIPGKEHLKELRHQIKHKLKNEEYSNKEVIDCFKEHCELINTLKARKISNINKTQLENLIQMTPLMFDMDSEHIDYNSISKITIDSEILIGKIK